jgi:hypothetical protein
MRKVIKYLGLCLVVVLAVAIVWHRFSYPDMTQVRWFIEFWYIWLAWFVLTITGYWLYLFGNGDICPTKRPPDKGGRRL